MEVLGAFLAGALVIVSMSVNGALADSWGVFRSGAVNYAVGWAGAAVLALAIPAAAASPAPWWAWSGGCLGVAIVCLSNWAVPRVPATQAAVLLFAGQSLMSLVLEAARTGTLPWLKLAGLALISAALIWKTRQDRRHERSEVA